MKIRAAILEAMGEPRPYRETTPLTVTEVDLEGPGHGELLVRIHSAGLCHSDLSVIDGNRPRPTPMALGHEASGVVADTGPGVTRFKEGDHVVLVFVPSCGVCLPCASGRPALCEPGAASNAEGTLLQGARRITRDGVPVHHHLGVSAFAQYATVSEHSAIKIDPDFNLATAALFGCAVLTGAGAVVNTARVNPGASVAVVGLGGVGLSAVLGAIAAGAEKVLAVDLSDAKLELAASLGATATFNASSPDAMAAVRDATDGGVEYAFEMAGSVPALSFAYGITRRGGTTVTAGLPHPEHKLEIPAVSLVAEERTLKGSYIGTSVPTRDLPRFMGLYEQGRLPVDKLHSATLRLDDINAGFDDLADGTAVRQVIHMD